MAEDKISMNYEHMEQTIRLFKQCADDVDNMIKNVNRTVALCQEGGLKGSPGDAFVQLMQGTAVPKLSKLREHYRNVANEVQEAMRAMQQKDQGSTGLFAR